MVFQNYALYPHMSVFDNIAYPLENQRMKKDEVRERVTKTAGCSASPSTSSADRATCPASDSAWRWVARSFGSRRSS